MLLARHSISAVLMFAIPIIDTTIVVIKRLKNRSSPFVGGRDHTSHHLSYLGLSDRKVAFVFISISLISMILTIIILNYLVHWKTLYSVIFSLYVIILFAVLYYIANINKPIIR